MHSQTASLVADTDTFQFLRLEWKRLLDQELEVYVVGERGLRKGFWYFKTRKWFKNPGSLPLF